VKIVVCDTMKRRGLVGSEYDLRRAQCEEAARLLGQWIPDVKALRDVSAADFEAHKDKLPEVTRKRAEHVIYENERVLASREVLQSGNFVKFGRLLDASNDSARDLYEDGRSGRRQHGIEHQQDAAASGEVFLERARFRLEERSPRTGDDDRVGVGWHGVLAE
jgi:hypothetical protein